MDTKNTPFLAALALTVCAPAALAAAPPTAPTAAPANAEITVKLTVPAASGKPLALPFVLFQSPPSPPKPQPPISAAQAKQDTENQRADTEALLQMIVPKGVTVQVRPNPLVEGGYVAVLTATGPMDPTKVAEIADKATAAVGKAVLVVSNIRPPDPNDPHSPVTLTYTLRFLRGTLPDVTATNASTSDITGIGTDTAATDLASFLSKVYTDTTVTAHENHLVLTGPAEYVNALRQMLALSLDVPSPQVKADIYTIQVNTTPHNRDAAQDKIEEIQAGIQIVRDFIHGSQAYLAAYLASPQAGVAVKTAAQKAALVNTLAGSPLTDAQKAALAGNPLTDAQKIALTDALDANPLTDTLKETLKATLAGGPLTQDQETALNNSAKGSTLTDAQKTALQVALQVARNVSDRKATLTEALKNSPLTDAHDKAALVNTLAGDALTPMTLGVLNDALESIPSADAPKHSAKAALADILSDARKRDLFAKMRLAGYDPSPKRPLSLTDMLILLVVADRAQFKMALTPHKEEDFTTGELANFQKCLTLTQQKLSIPERLALFPGKNGEVGKLRLADLLEISLDRTRQQIGKEDAISRRHSSKLPKLIERIEAQVEVARQSGTQIPVFSRLAALYPDDTASKEADMQGISDFLDAWHHCQGAFLVPSQNAEGALVQYPDQLSSKSAATDFLLKEAMDAVTADLQAVYFQPLLDWIRDDVRGEHALSTGIDLVGTTSITVRDRTLGETKGTAESYFKFTPIPHLTMDSLTGAKTLANGSPATADTTTQTVATDKAGVVRDHNGDPVLLPPNQQLATDKGGLAIRKGSANDGDPVILTVPNTRQTQTPSALASTVFGALTPLQSLALQAVLNEDATVPSYRKIAPGTSLAIRPFVLPDGGSARVQMSLTTTVTPDPPSAAQLALRDVPFDVISSHTVTTEATISAFDLQTVSSFGAQTTGPGDYAWRIPVLDQIPLLGELFHGPRSRETKRQDSIALVNLTILPRSLDLVPYYVAPP